MQQIRAKEFMTVHKLIGKLIHGNCARNLYSTKRTIGMWTNQNLSWRMRRTTFSGNLTYVQTDRIISARLPNQFIVNKRKKKRTCRRVDFAVPTDHWVKIIEIEKREISNISLFNFCYFARERKKLCNIKATLILLVIGSLGTIPKGLVKILEDLVIRGRAETIHNTVLLR